VLLATPNTDVSLRVRKTFSREVLQTLKV